MTVHLFGQEIESVTLTEAAEQVVALPEGGIIVTMNVDHVVVLSREAGLKRAYEVAAHRYADGMPVVWLARLLGKRLPERVTGADLVPAVLELAALHGLSVYLVGGTPATARAAEQNARARFPGLRWAGSQVPLKGFEKDPATDVAVAEAVAHAAPDLVMVCLGSPKQEEWALRHQHRLPGSTLLCVGAAVDFLAGTTSRAPRWAQRAGLEWLFRLLREPRRLWRRYLVRDPAFLLLAVREILRSRGRPPSRHE